MTVLSMVEATGGTPEQLAKIASDLFNGDDVAFRATEETMHLLHVDGLQLEGRDRSGRDRSQILAVGLRNPDGSGRGRVRWSCIRSLLMALVEQQGFVLMCRMPSTEKPRDSKWMVAVEGSG